MEIRITLFVTLFAYSFLVSQSFSYIIALHNTQRNLDAKGYIILRKLLDKNFRAKFKYVFYLTLVSNTVLCILTFREPDSLLFIGSLIALIGFLADAVFMLRGNMPINNYINTWSPEKFPADWEVHRAKWLRIFAKRQVANIIGFTSLLFVAAFS
jgi:hypothetical protein